MSRKGQDQPEKPSAADLRRQRLAEALRANLKRRKAARSSQAGGKASAPGPRLNRGDE
jgi:hypothetical protein